MTPSTSPRLSADSGTASDEARPEPTSLANPDTLEPTGRDQRFEDGVRMLRVGGASIRLDERLLMVLGGVLVPLGIIAVLLGWWGAAHSPYVFDQLPYVISGGLLGVGLVFLGGFLYFAHWMTELVKESRRHSADLLAALDRLEQRLTSAPATQPAVNGSSVDSAERWVATHRGTMAHRPDCVVVAGKSGLRSVSPGRDGLSLCKLCTAS